MTDKVGIGSNSFADIRNLLVPASLKFYRQKDADILQDSSNKISGLNFRKLPAPYNTIHADIELIDKDGVKSKMTVEIGKEKEGKIEFYGDLDKDSLKLILDYLKEQKLKKLIEKALHAKIKNPTTLTVLPADKEYIPLKLIKEDIRDIVINEGLLQVLGTDTDRVFALGLSENLVQVFAFKVDDKSELVLDSDEETPRFPVAKIDESGKLKPLYSITLPSMGFGIKPETIENLVAIANKYLDKSVK